MTPRLLPPDPHEVVLPAAAGLPEAVHLFDPDEVMALNAALVARRPLLVRGEPGTGKSQLARAAAQQLGRRFVQHTVDALTEPRDLLWTVDAVSRLAEAQVAATLGDATQAREAVALRRFLEPGALWWAFAWEHADDTCTERKGSCLRVDGGDDVVVLIDEIDKADESVPNGLLEALAYRRFDVPDVGTVQAVRAPLVIVTTNEERALPAAFLRRCLVLTLSVPEGRDALRSWLLPRARAHFPGVDETLLADAADMLAEDRVQAKRRELTPPGLAEYLDLLRAVTGLRPGDAAGQRALLDRVRSWTFRKHGAPGADGAQ